MHDKSEDYFRGISWCVALLNSPDTVIFTPSFRTETPFPGLPASQDQLMRVSLNSPTTVPHCLGFHKDYTSDIVGESSSTAGPRLLVNSASLLIDIGPGVNGFHGSAHGGFVSVLFDDAMGALLYQNLAMQSQKQRADASWKLPANTVDIAKLQYATAGMDVRLQRPLPTPGVVVATAKLARIDGRKLAVDVVIKDERGKQLATCKGLWVSLLSGKM